MKDTYDVFISYRRNGGEHTAKIINDSLTALGFKVFFDVEALRSGEFNTKLLDVIDHCRDVIIILSENSLDRCVSEEDWVRKEISRALQMNKNIVPVLLRNFSFPKSLPEEIEPLRWKNGVEASTEFYDAFVEKLQRFLVSKPVFYKRIFRPGKLRGLWIPAAVAAVTGLVVFGAIKLSGRTFPDSMADHNLVSEALYEVSTDMVLVNEALQTYQDSVGICQKYINQSAGASLEKVEEQLYYTAERLPKIGEMLSSPDEKLLERMADTPLPVADFKALYDQSISMCDEMNRNIAFVSWLISCDGLTAETKDRYLELMTEYAELEAQYYCYYINSVFYRCDCEELSRFRLEALTLCTKIYTGQTWLTTEQELTGHANWILSSEENLSAEMALLIGNEHVLNDEIETALARLEEKYERYLQLVLQDEEMKQQLAKSYEMLEEKYRPLETDDEDLLWGKMIVANAYQFTDLALACLTFYENKSTLDNKESIVDAARRYSIGMEETGISCGVIVLQFEPGLEPPEGIALGDVIISVNQTEVYTVDEFDLARNGEDEFTATLLRFDETGCRIIEQQVTTKGKARLLLNSMSIRQ